MLHKTGDEIKTGVLTFANNLNLAAISVNSINGFILKNNQPFIHNFYAGTNPLTGGIGNNTFVGVNSGNFNPNNFTYASTMIGFESGMSNKNGYSNTGIGYYALRLNENGFGNTALGTFVLGNSINGNQNTSVGWHSMLYRTGGSSNTGMGVDVLKENLTGNLNTAFGTNAGANNVSGDLNLFLGYAAGFNELGSSKLYISNSSTANPLIKGDFSTNSLALGGGVGNKIDIYGVGSIIKTDYKTHANALIPIIYDASNYTFNLNTSGAFTINSTGAAVGLTSGNINKFEVLTASSTGGSSVNGMAVHDGQIQRMALSSGVNTASSYSWIQSIIGGVGFKPIFLNPNGGGVSIGNTTDLGTGTLNVSGNISTIAAITANQVPIKSQLDLKSDIASPTFTGNPTAPTATAGTNTTQIATTAFVTGAIATADAGNPTNTAYVETSGNNATAQLGNSSRPFLTIDAALDALPAGGGVVKIGIGTFASPAVAKIKSNTAFIGSKEPIINSTITFATPTSRATITAPTALIDGTILSGQFRIEDRNNIRIENLGVDAGKTYIDTFNGGVATNAMAILSTVSTTPCRNITVNNTTALGYSPSALFHAFVFQNVTDCHFSNLTSYYNTHGLVIKGKNITVDGLKAHSHTADGLIIKSYIYAPCADVSLSNINISSLSGYEGGGISLEESVLGSSPLDRITISNVNLKYVSYGVRNVNTVKNVSISSLNAYDLNSFGFKLDTNVDNVNLSNINIVKTLTEGIDVSINGTETVNITNANVSDATGTGFKLTTAGTSIINIVNSNTLTTTASYLITGSGVYGNSNFGTGTKTGVINFKSQSITDSVSGVNFFTGLATQTVNMLALPTGTISFANANTSTSPTIYSKSSNSRGLLILTGTPDVNASADFEFGVRKNDNTDFSTLTSTAFRFTRFGTTLIDVLRNGNTTFAGNISAPLFTGSASLTGNPTAPTATAGTNTTQIATTAFVTNAVSTGASSGTYTLSFSSLTNISSPSDGLVSSYIKVGNIVTVMITLSCTVTVANTLSAISVNLPIARANVTGAVQIGSCSIQDTAQTTQGSAGIVSSTATNTVILSLKPLLSGSSRLTAHITYNVLQ